LVDTDNSGATSNNTASNTTASTNGGLQIKKELKKISNILMVLLGI
jgi:hypothetical protein